MSVQKCTESSKQSTATSSSLSAEPRSGSSTCGGTASSPSSRRQPPPKRVELTTNVHFDASRDAFKDIRRLLELFQEHNIPGPLLLRTKTDFTFKVGSGGQGLVSAASQDYVSALETLLPVGGQGTWIWPNSITRAQCVSHWKTCVVKQLRSKNRNLEYEAASAVREVLSLCRAVELSKRSDYIVRLLGWGICLDDLESGDLSRSRLPFLVLERATCDMEQFIKQGLHRQLDTATKLNMGLEIGIGLYAIHSAQMTHGDMKLSNVLVFSDSRKGWNVKLCDFGSASEITHNGFGQYSGTDTWRPPETLYSKVPVDLISCDVFAYGLLLWAWLIGLTMSPICDLENGQIRANLGGQQFFHRALPDIVKEFGERSDIKWLETQSVYSGLSTTRAEPSRPLTLCGITLLNIRGQSTDNETREFESLAVTGILNTLAAALDELPNNRSREPWHYLQWRRLQESTSRANTTRLKPPKTFSRGRITVESHRADAKDRLSILQLTVQKRDLMVRVTHRALQRLINRLQFKVETYILILTGRTRRITVFQQFHRIFFDVLGRDSDEITQVKHSNHEFCRHLSQSSVDRLESLLSPYHAETIIERCLRYFVLLTSGRVDLLRTWQWQDHTSYALARIRSRFPDDVCWDRLFTVRPELGIEIDQSIARLRTTSTDVSLVWAFRNRTALDIPENVHENYFIFLEDTAVSDNDKTFRLHLLLEKGFFLGRKFGTSSNEPSIFLRYLINLKDPAVAVRVCRHFRRISSLDGAIDMCKFYYTGLSDPSMIESDKSDLNTCLHDAVRALNTDVIKYLKATDFRADAKDQNDLTALDILKSNSYGRATYYGQDWRARQIIQTLLTEWTKPEQGESDLPLGWETWQSSTTPAYIETSTAVGMRAYFATQQAPEYPYPITFKKPSTGLYQNNVIALVRRQISQNEDESYLLNPLRFLRTQSQIPREFEPAKTPRFNETWYEDEVKTLDQHPEEFSRRPQSHHGRLFVFLLAPAPLVRKALAWHHVETYGKLLASGDLLTVIFGPFSLTARLQHWNVTTQFILSALALAGVYARLWHVLDYAPPQSLGQLDLVRPWLRSRTGQLDQIYNCGTFLLDLTVVLLFCFRLASQHMYAFLVGSIMMSGLLTLGLGALSAGVRSRRSMFNCGTPLFDCVSFSVFTAGFTCALKARESGGLLGTGASITISRVAALISLVVFIAFLFFVCKSHADFFDEDEYVQDIVLLRSGRGIRRAQRLGELTYDQENEHNAPLDGITKIVIYILVVLLLGAAIGDNVVHSIAGLTDESSLNPTLAITILLPVISKCVITFKIASFGYVNKFQTVVTRTVGLSVAHGLVIASLLIIIGWCRGQSVSYDFTLGQVVFLFFQWRIVREALYDGYSEYFQGLNLIALYIIFILCTVLFPKF